MTPSWPRRQNEPPRLIHMDFADIELRVIATLAAKGITMTDTFDYQSLALRTKSDQLFPVSGPLLIKLLENASKAAEDLDAVKKSLFYGKELPPHLVLISNTLPPIDDVQNGVPTDALHSIIGIITEGGELADLALRTLFEDQEFDAVNFGEELGDVAWYRAVGLNAIGQTIDQNDRQNIGKLELRFPEKFEMNLALNRDLDSERTHLEGGARLQPEYDAVLSNVSLIDRGGMICLRGTIRDDKRGRFTDGAVIRTTRLHDLKKNDADQLIATTKNTTYLVESLEDAASS